MQMKPPTLPLNYVPAISVEELVHALELIEHATAPTPDDGGHHEAAHDISSGIMNKLRARRVYEASGHV